MNTPTLDSQLCFALYSASSHVTNIYRPMLEELNITYPQYLVLMALWEEDNISISQLALKTTIGKSTLTPLLKLLEKKNLLSRALTDHDERQKRIVLTSEGNSLSSSAGDVAPKAFHQTGLSKADAAEIIRLCQLMIGSSNERVAKHNKASSA